MTRLAPISFFVFRRIVFLLIPVYLTINLFVFTAQATDIALPAAKEPSFEDLLRASETDPSNPQVLEKSLLRLIKNNPGAIDADFEDIKNGEENWLSDELYKRKAIQWEQNELIPKIDDPLMKAIVKELEDRRIQDPRRQIDALLRQLEKVGTASELPTLQFVARSAKTQLGVWRSYATIQGIFEREELQKIVAVQDLDILIIAPLLRDLSSLKAGQLAEALWNRFVVEAEKSQTRVIPSLATRLWLAWSISEMDPKKAFDIFKLGLNCHDPAIRVFSGMGILRISSEDAVPFLFTAPPAETETVRQKWLLSIKPQKPETYRFANPFSLPIINERRGPPVDLQWFDENGKIVKKDTDVWPSVRAVLPDGSLYCISSVLGRLVVLCSKSGETIAMHPRSRAYYDFRISETGGLWASTQDSTLSSDAPKGEKAVELSPTGEELWALPRRQKILGTAGRGTVLVNGVGTIDVVNRRGDVIWSVKKLVDDIRSAYMLDSSTLLVAERNDIRILSRDKGLVKTISGFKSLDWIRYHKSKSWIIYDAGYPSISIYDPRTEFRIDVRIGWTSDSANLWSKWLPKGENNRFAVE